MTKVLEFILGVVLVILYIAICFVILGVLLAVCGIAFLIGAVGGAGWGLIKGIMNYFGALKKEVAFKQY